MYVSDGIKKSLQITQNGRTIEDALSRANFHLETNGALRLYLTKEGIERDVCFESDLLHRLCEYLAITNASAQGLIGAVSRKDNLHVIDKILEYAGVAQMDGDFTDPDEDLEALEVEPGVTVVVDSSKASLAAPRSVKRAVIPSSSARFIERPDFIPIPNYSQRIDIIS